jgi:SAM-dependent methyltransferase
MRADQGLEADRRDDCPCLLCGAAAEAFLIAGGRSYHRCAICGLRFAAPDSHPAREAELAEYRLHRNDPADPGYRRFLSKLADPLTARLPPGAAGLDYGCGPGPALALMLRERGHPVALYDPVFAADPAPLSRTWDFVTCTEVAEHFHSPARDFARLRGLVRPGGWLAVMTCFQTDDARFEGWHYRSDPTHVAFYRAGTFHWLAARWGWSCEVPAKDVALLRRPGAGTLACGLGGG